MTNALIEIMPGEYENPDVIENVIKYICRFDKAEPFTLCPYGAIFSPNVTETCQNIIQAFYDSRNIQVSPPERHLWHFVISFASNFHFIDQKHFYFIDAVAQLFSSEYVNCYSYHTDTDNPHFHFAISTASYIPDVPPLTPSKMYLYISRIIQLATTYKITLTQVEKE